MFTGFLEMPHSWDISMKKGFSNTYSKKSLGSLCFWKSCICWIDTQQREFKESSVSSNSLWSPLLILIINSMQQWWGIFHKEMFCQKLIYHSSIIYPPMQYRPFNITDCIIFRLSSHCCDFQQPNKLLIWTADYLKLCWSISHWCRNYVEKDFCAVSAMNVSLVLATDVMGRELGKQTHSKSPFVQYRWLLRGRRGII